VIPLRRDPDRHVIALVEHLRRLSPETLEEQRILLAWMAHGGTISRVVTDSTQVSRYEPKSQQKKGFVASGPTFSETKRQINCSDEKTTKVIETNIKRIQRKIKRKKDNREDQHWLELMCQAWRRPRGACVIAEQAGESAYFRTDFRTACAHLPGVSDTPEPLVSQTRLQKLFESVCEIAPYA
jgi:hypothetical protein